jgi:hypothetical protein
MGKIANMMLMKQISRQRHLIETEGRHHAVIRGWRRRLHFENMPSLCKMLDFLLTITHTKWIGRRGALTTHINRIQINFENLPAAFDGTKILFISDFHIDTLPELETKILNLARGVDYDFCILGGDYEVENDTTSKSAKQIIERIAKGFAERTPVFGVLGNHDLYRMGELLESCGVKMLVNDSDVIEKDGQKLFIAGIDDCHYYLADDVTATSENLDDDAFGIMVSHSPEPYKKIHQAGFDLCLSGHTHGGQICLPGGIAVVANTTAPRYMLKGKWKYRGMQGYTSTGVGSSGVVVRFFCKPEIALITLRRTTPVQNSI